MTKSILRAAYACVVAALFILSPGQLPGQAISGDLTGRVLDASGSTIPSAAVEARNEATSVKTSATAGTDGVYRIGNLPIGIYTVTAAAKGFSGGGVKGVRITLSNVVTQNITLQVGATATTVDVTDAPPPIDTTTAQLQTSFDARQVQDLPTASFSKTINGAGIWNLSLLGAGVSSQGGVGQGTGPAVAGQRPEDNTFFLDGVSNNNHYSTGPLVYVSNEAIGEVSVLQNQFSAEFGGASGGVFNAVVASGGNAIHGTVYNYLQNRKLNAVDSTSWTQGLTSNPRFDNNRLGMSIGGPILKNKLFYFGNMEYNPLGQSAVPGAPLYAPTAAGYSTLAGISALSKTNLGVLQQYVPAAPVANEDPLIVAGKKVAIGDISFVNPTYTNSYNALTSIDYNLSEKDQLRGRWVYNKSQGLESPGPNLPIFAVNSPNNNYLLSVSEFHNFTPTLQNEFRGSFSRNVNSLGLPDTKFPGLNVFPQITLDELNGLTLGPDGPSGSIQNLFQLQDNVSKVWGKHTIKAGYHFTDVILTNYFIQRVTGNYEYNSLEQYLLDLTPDVLGERSAGATSYPAGFLQHEAFVNDDFRVRPNLTLNLGLRYEYVTIPVASRYQSYSSPANVAGGITFGEPKPNPNEWSPRLGFAYSPGKAGVWSIRGGFSRSFDLTYANLTSNASPPYFQQTNDVDLNSNAPNFLKNGALSGALVPLPKDPKGALAVIGSYTFGGKRPYGLTWNMGVQRIIAKNYTLEVRYVGTKGVHLWNQSRLNIQPRVTATQNIPTFFSTPSAATLAALPLTLGQLKSVILPGATAALPFNTLAAAGSQANIVGYAPQAYSHYEGLAVQLNRRMTNNLSFIAAYTWSHNIDDATATNFSTYLTPRRAQDYLNLAAEKSSSALDRRQRLTYTAIYDYKPFQNGNWFLKNAVGNWSVSGTYTYETPEYATVQSGVDSNLNNDSAGDRTVVNPAGDANTGSNVRAYNAAGQVVSTGNAGIVAYVAVNPNARYVIAQSGAYANGGRNTFPLHPINNVDMSLSKRFSIGERLKMEFSGQFFNLFNHAQYTGGYVSDVSSNVNLSSRNELIPSNNLFGRFDQFYSSNSRNVQLLARFRF